MRDSHQGLSPLTPICQKECKNFLHHSFCVTILFSQNRRCFYFLLSSIAFIPAVSMSFALNRFPRCATVGVSLAKVVYSACLPLFLLPQNQLEARKGPIHHPQLGPALNLLTRMELFHFPFSPLLSLYPHLPQTNQKKHPPKFHCYTEVTYRRSKPERGSLFPAQKHFGHSHVAHCLECGSQKNNNKNKHYEIWSMAWNLILVKCLLRDGIEHCSVANDSSNILKGRPSILKEMDKLINNTELRLWWQLVEWVNGNGILVIEMSISCTQMHDSKKKKGNGREGRLM